MTSVLVSKIGDEYLLASKFNGFFSQDEERSLNRFRKREEAPANKAGNCCGNLFFGFFFDGTRNNYRQAEAVNAYSNIARLYDCFPGQSVPDVLASSSDWKNSPSDYEHFFRVYIPGVGSPFKEIGDSGEGLDKTLGAAMGRKGNDRIVWALLQAINNVNRYFLGQPLIQPAEAMSLAKKISLSKEARAFMVSDGGYSSFQRPNVINTPRLEFDGLLRRLHKNVSQHWKRGEDPPSKKEPAIIEKIYISMFGFSRGATQARAFANWLVALCQLDANLRGESQLSLGGFPVVFDFLGIFDTVASVGMGNTAGNFMLTKAADGHGGWADAEDSLRISSSINRCVHLVAAHELRRSFPLDSVSVGFALPGNAKEIVFPGVHSDVGGGYVPREQGKGIDSSGSDMLSRLPLLYMYKEARLAGVPLKLELADEIVQSRFATTQKVIDDFNAYLSVCTIPDGRITDIVREHQVLQMAWRYARRSNGPSPLHKTASFLRASNFDKNDLESSNKDFDEELAEFEDWRAGLGERKPQQQIAGFANSYANELEEIAWHWPLKLPSPEVMSFFDEYVHDSRAGFKLLGEDSEQGAIEELQEWSKELAFYKKQYENMFEGGAAAGPPNYGMDPNKRKAAEEYDRTGKIPRYHVGGREPYFAARAGYFRFRKIYGGSDSVLLSKTLTLFDNNRAYANNAPDPRPRQEKASEAA